MAPATIPLGSRSVRRPRVVIDLTSSPPSSPRKPKVVIDLSSFPPRSPRKPKVFIDLTSSDSIPRSSKSSPSKVLTAGLSLSSVHEFVPPSWTTSAAPSAASASAAVSSAATAIANSSAAVSSAATATSSSAATATNSSAAVPTANKSSAATAAASFAAAEDEATSQQPAGQKWELEDELIFLDTVARLRKRNRDVIPQPGVIFRALQREGLLKRRLLSARQVGEKLKGLKNKFGKTAAVILGEERRPNNLRAQMRRPRKGKLFASSFDVWPDLTEQVAPRDA